jgi:hypothetical protein
MVILQTRLMELLSADVHPVPFTSKFNIQVNARPELDRHRAMDWSTAAFRRVSQRIYMSIV